MISIIDYVERFGEHTFAERKFNEVDALVLSQFAYLKFDGQIFNFMENRPHIELRQLAESMSEAVVFADKRYEKNNKALFLAMVHSPRFSSMKINYYTNIVSEAAETQFAALTVFPEGSLPVVLFRGTDETIIGWKEDFNMSFKWPVTGQTLSSLYLNQVGYRILGNFIVSGHSKGGNFAVYAAMNVREEVQERLARVYSFDGPGFRPEILESVDFNKIRTRVKKFLPQSSIIGMILQSQEEYRVVECASIGLLQHDPYNWRVRENHFKPIEDLSRGQKLFNKTLNDWILSRDDAQLEIFVETLYEVVESVGAKTLIEMAREPGKSINGILDALREIDKETREKLKEILLALVEIGAENFFARGSKKKRG